MYFVSKASANKNSITIRFRFALVKRRTYLAVFINKAESTRSGERFCDSLLRRWPQCVSASDAGFVDWPI